MISSYKRKEKDWFRLKKYPHIGLPLETSDRVWLNGYVKNKTKVTAHAFSPFIYRNTEKRKFRKEIAHDGTRSKLRKPSIKERDIFYANHIDSNIYAFYSQLIQSAYEEKLLAAGLNDCVTAYRRLKLHPDKLQSRNKCNVDFADEIFSFIKTSKHPNLIAITFDIKGFFDNLDHKLLKKSWRSVINSGLDLPSDHYNVFRNITKFSYVNENNLFESYKNQIIVEREPDVIKEIKIKKKFYLRKKRAIAFCNSDELKNIRNAGLIKANKYLFDKKTNKALELRNRGIPQGSPISSTLANVYLMDFDKAVNDHLSSLNGIYRRYSDDMVAVCKFGDEQNVIDFFVAKIQEFNLEIQDSKTQVFKFVYKEADNRFYCLEKNRRTKKFNKNTTFEYLGFQFDGKHTLLKNSSIAGYYRKMKRSIASGRFYTYHNKTKTKGELFKSRLYKRFTHVGSLRRRIYSRHKVHKDRFVLSHKYDWGNYLTYAKLSSKIISDNKITGQLKRHWKKFHMLIKAV